MFRALSGSPDLVSPAISGNGDPELLNRKIIMSNSRSPGNWDEVLAAFEIDLQSKGRAQKSIEAYVSTLRLFGHFYREELRKPGPHASRLQETDLFAFVDHLRSQRYLAASSLNRAISALNAFSRLLMERRWHRRDVARDLRTFYVALPTKPERLSPTEVRRLISSVNLNAKNGYRDLAMVQLLVQCGLRVGEITRLVVDDVVIHQSTGQVRIRDQKTRSDRSVPLNASARDALRKYLYTCGERAGHEPLFLSQQGKRLSIKSIQYHIKKYLCAAGRPDLSARDLRHHFALGVYERNGNLAVVQRLLGHRNMATTARYIQPTDKEIAGAVEDLPENVYHAETPIEPTS